MWGAGNSSAATAASIQPLLDYLAYTNQANSSTRFWIGAAPDATSTNGSVSPASWRTVDGNGHIAAFNSTTTVDTTDMALSALCTQSAP